MFDHVKAYAKAYTAGAAVLIIGSLAIEIVDILAWMVSLAGITIPVKIQAALTHIITAVAGGGAAGLTKNAE